MIAELLTREFHRIDKESLHAERTGKSLLTGEGNTSRRKPFYANHTISCHNLPSHSCPSPAKSARIPAQLPTRRSPPTSGPFRIWVTVWVSLDPGGEGQQANTVFSSITNKNQPDLERSELIFCWVLPTALAGKGFEPHDLRVMRC